MTDQELATAFTASTSKWSQLLGLIWDVRDKDLRFHYERHEVGNVILPLVVLRRLDFVLAPTKAKVRLRSVHDPVWCLS